MDVDSGCSHVLLQILLFDILRMGKIPEDIWERAQSAWGGGDGYYISGSFLFFIFYFWVMKYS